MRASPCKPSRLYLGAGVPYEPRVRILSATTLLPLILLVPSATEAQPKDAQPKDAQPKDAQPKDAQAKKPEYTKGPVGKAPAPCGAKILPLVEGNKWTYGFIAAHDRTGATVAPREELVKLSPSEPQQIVITVKTVETKGPDTVITLEEKTTSDLSKDPKKHILDERTITSTITCNQKKFEISPESFFFAGEPGGFFGITFDKFERPKDTSLKLINGTLGESEWREDIIAHFTRTAFAGSNAKLDSGKLELERKFTPEQSENVNTQVGLYFAEPLVLVTTGRVTLDHPQPDTKPMELPDHWLNRLWLVPNVGIVQVLNSYAHMYTLTAVQLK
jgi:hypothetical protein